MVQHVFQDMETGFHAKGFKRYFQSNRIVFIREGSCKMVMPGYTVNGIDFGCGGGYIQHAVIGEVAADRSKREGWGCWVVGVFYPFGRKQVAINWKNAALGQKCLVEVIDRPSFSVRFRVLLLIE